LPARGTIVARPAGRCGRSWRSASSKKFWAISRPYSVEIDSGWNWTPQIGRLVCSTPITTPSSAQATTRPSGPGGVVIASEW
jgi:hypothetical protein